MENNFRSYLDSARSILIILSKKPYFDQVAAGLSLYLSLLGKRDVDIVCPSPMLVEFNRLVGVDKVKSELENKNLVIRIANYKASDIERVSSEVKNEELYLTVIPRSGVNPPLKDQVMLSHSGVSADLIILIGGADQTHFPMLSNPDLASLPKIHVGLRPLSLGQGVSVISFARHSSSVSEIVADLIREAELEVDGDTASNLIAGIEVGSNHYTTDGVSADTFQTIADLMRLGGRRLPQLPKKNYPQGAIPTVHPTFQATGVENKEEKNTEGSLEEAPPQDWLAPKIFKGTSIS
jgi:hypothetical protein